MLDHLLVILPVRVLEGVEPDQVEEEGRKDDLQQRDRFPQADAPIPLQPGILLHANAHLGEEARKQSKRTLRSYM